MTDPTASTTDTYVISDPGMYGIESVLLMKHEWPVGHEVVRGALVFDRETGHQYFVTERDLARYQQPSKVPTIDSP